MRGKEEFRTGARHSLQSLKKCVYIYVCVCVCVCVCVHLHRYNMYVCFEDRACMYVLGGCMDEGKRRVSNWRQAFVAKFAKMCIFSSIQHVCMHA